MLPFLQPPPRPLCPAVSPTPELPAPLTLFPVSRPAPQLPEGLFRRHPNPGLLRGAKGGWTPGTDRAPADRPPEDWAGGARVGVATQGRARPGPARCRPRPAAALSNKPPPPASPARPGGGRALPVHVGAGLGAEEAGRPSWLDGERRRGGGQAGQSQAGSQLLQPGRGPRGAGLLGAWSGRVGAGRDASGGPVKRGRGGGRRGEPPR